MEIYISHDPYHVIGHESETYRSFNVRIGVRCRTRLVSDNFLRLIQSHKITSLGNISKIFQAVLGIVQLVSILKVTFFLKVHLLY